MKKPQKIILGAIWSFAALLLVVVAVLWYATRPQRLAATADAQTNASFPQHFSPPTAIPSYAFTDENGKPFTTDAMKGGVWIADFVFTQCQGPCPMMTTHMAQLQKTLSGKHVRFVSFSVDPENDTPAVLKKYAAQYGADLSTWSFVTGTQSDVIALARTLLIGVTAASGKMPIAHSVKFLLINPAGRVQGYYDGNNPAEVKNLAHDAAALAGS